MSWSAQNGDTDPQAAFNNHLAINSPPPQGPLFAYRADKGGYKPLTKAKFLEVVQQVAKRAGLDPLQGHGIQIGSMLEYLLREVLFDVMKAKGRWASNALLIYLWKHAQVLVPYMQAVLTNHEGFVCLTMLPVSAAYLQLLPTLQLLQNEHSGSLSGMVATTQTGPSDLQIFELKSCLTERNITGIRNSWQIEKPLTFAHIAATSK
ncbi:hypothetical protein BYT27DRAFT_7207547 [Phlegmacium glaucopus]|nr:hypothetical protein BYT27DRAFT_7207547 [Phlegmacium glaucopus]